VQFSDSLTWDGEKYIDYTLHFPQVAFGQTLNVYYFQRIFPSGLIYYSLKLLGLPLTTHAVFYAFLALNILLIFISFGIWLLVCKQLALSNRGKLLGFTGLFINFAIMKMAFYYPVLTDIMAFTLGLSLLYFYLKRSSTGLLSMGLIGAFTLPTLFYSSLILFIFPIQYRNDVSSNNYDLGKRWIALSMAFSFLLLIIVFVFYRQVPLLNPSPPVVLFISIAAVLVYLYLSASYLFSFELYKQCIQNFKAWGKVLLAVSIFIGIYMTIFWGASDEPSPLNYKGFLANIVITSIANPFAFLVAHVVYVGPAVLLLIYYNKSFINLITRYGLGLHGLVAGYVLLSVNSETRLFINIWPFFIAFLCKTLENRKLPVSFYFWFFLVSLALSKFWYGIEVASFSKNYLKFPEQKYFMSIGPWMSDAMYGLQGSIILLLFLWMYCFFLRKYKPPILK
jgi:hypothetical protein